MRLPEVVYCQSCYRQDQRTPAAWAHPDPTNPKKADFYCIRCLTAEGIDIADCETLEAWRKMVNDGTAPTPPTRASDEAMCGCGKPRHKGLCWYRRGSPKPKEKAKPQCSGDLCECGREARHRGRCRTAPPKASRVIEKKTAYTPGVPASHALRVAVSAAAVRARIGHIDVGGFKARTVTLDDYKAMAPARNNGMTKYDAILKHVGQMKPKTVLILETPRDTTTKNFRNRLAHVLQRANKLPVQVEQRKKENTVAIIREAQ